MKSALMRRALSWPEAVACLLWVLIGLGVAAATMPTLGTAQGDWPHVLSMLSLVLALLYAGVAYALGLRGARVVVGVMSCLLILYAVILVLMGTEDVGGPWVSVPSAVALTGFAGYNLCLLRLSAHRTLAE